MVMLVLRNMFSRARNVLCIFTGSIARSAKRRYLSYSEADFRVFRLAGATRCMDGVKFRTEASVPNFTLIDWCNDQGIGPPKLKKFY